MNIKFAVDYLVTISGVTGVMKISPFFMISALTAFDCGSSDIQFITKR